MKWLIRVSGIEEVQSLNILENSIGIKTHKAHGMFTNHDDEQNNSPARASLVEYISLASSCATTT